MAASNSDLGEFEILQVDSLRERVYNQIKKLILTNRLVPGQQIVIDQLVKQLNVSHTPVREALAMLEWDGLVAIERYKNARVTKIDASDVREVYEVRILMEGWAASKAAILLSDEKLAGLGAVIDKTCDVSTPEHIENFINADVMLHDSIIACIDNRLFSRLSRLAGDQSKRIRSLVEATRPAEARQVIYQEHCSVLEGLRLRDPDIARQRMTTHLEAAMQRTLAALADIPASNSE